MFQLSLKKVAPLGILLLRFAPLTIDFHSNRQHSEVLKSSTRCLYVLAVLIRVREDPLLEKFQKPFFERLKDILFFTTMWYVCQ